MARPNVILIVADDMGYGDFGAFNDGYGETPTLDSMVRSGTCLSQQYAGSPVCSPSRAALLTGRYPIRTGAVTPQEVLGYDRLALDLGVVQPNQRLVTCTGAISLLGRPARCWNAGGHGPQDMVQAIQNSCNVYFYTLGARIGLDRFLETGVRLGFTQRTGIDVPGERAPQFPESREYWMRRLGYRAPENEVISLSIGQGPMTMTIIKLAQMYAAPGNGAPTSAEAPGGARAS
jgi:hypothetical protein